MVNDISVLLASNRLQITALAAMKQAANRGGLTFC
jgi:hypothetical protein